MDDRLDGIEGTAEVTLEQVQGHGDNELGHPDDDFDDGVGGLDDLPAEVGPVGDEAVQHLYHLRAGDR